MTLKQQINDIYSRQHDADPTDPETSIKIENELNDIWDALALLAEAIDSGQRLA